jgi:hypothetical protein
LDPERFNIVHHRDGNKLNNRASNLQWTTSSGNTQAAVADGSIKTKDVYQYSLSTGHFIKKFGSARKAANATGLPSVGISQCASGCSGQQSSGGFIWTYEVHVPGKRVKIPVCTDQTKEIYQYALHTGTFIMKHDSAQLAAEAIGGNKCSISHCASGCRGAKSSGGFIWSYELSACVTTRKRKVKVSKPVYQINLQTGVLIRKFESTNEAASLLKNGDGIRKCARGVQKSANGFSWSYNPTSRVLLLRYVFTYNFGVEIITGLNSKQ